MSAVTVTFVAVAFALPGASPPAVECPGHDALAYACVIPGPGAWRAWPILTTDPQSREDRCRWRLDARRLLRGEHLTRGVPRRCMSRTSRQARPDPYDRRATRP